MTIEEMSTAAADLAIEARSLWDQVPSVPTKWLYDDRGSRLFDEITRVPEYYPTRRETEILTSHAVDIAQAADAQLVAEFGSGTSTKSRLLLAACASEAAVAGTELTYLPIDVSEAVLLEAEHALAQEFPGVRIEPLVADFTAPLQLPRVPGARLAVFLGGTIGNFDEGGRRDFFDRMAAALSPGDHFLLGADLIKNAGRLLAAYDDKGGVTADFNRNVVEVMRTLLGARGLFVDDFDHVARWNPTEHRMEMWLRARRPVAAHFDVLDRDWNLAAGAELLTEISTKFNPADLSGELADAGFGHARQWTDSHGDFTMVLSRRV